MAAAATGSAVNASGKMAEAGPVPVWARSVGQFSGPPEPAGDLSGNVVGSKTQRASNSGTTVRNCVNCVLCMPESNMGGLWMQRAM